LSSKPTFSKPADPSSNRPSRVGGLASIDDGGDAAWDGDDDLDI